MVPHDVQDAEEQVVCLLLKKIEKKKQVITQNVENIFCIKYILFIK